MPGERPVNGFSHRNRDGTPKARLTRQAAEIRVSGDADLSLIAYKCDTCHGWHIGHSHSKRRQTTAWTRMWDQVASELNLTA